MLEKLNTYKHDVIVAREKKKNDSSVNSTIFYLASYSPQKTLPKRFSRFFLFFM